MDAGPTLVERTRDEDSVGLISAYKGDRVTFDFGPVVSVKSGKTITT